MRAVTWQGAGKMQVDTVPDPQIINPRDSIVRVTTTCICGSDLHMYDGYIPTVRRGDIMGHEFMGEVVEVGSAVRNLQVGDRVLVPFTIACGECFFCQHELWSLCDNSNPNAAAAEEMYGYSPAGLFGYSHLFGGYAGGQAEFVRVPFSDVGCFKVPEEITDDQAVMLTDIFPTGYMAAENCNIHGGDTVAVWGCGPVGQFAIRSAYLLGAERVIAIDRVPERLEMARHGGADTLNYEEVDVIDALKEMTGGMGPDSVIDAVGMEAHGAPIAAMGQKLVGMLPDRIAAGLATRAGVDRLTTLHAAMETVRRGGTVSIIGVYGGAADPMNMMQMFDKGITIRMGQAHVKRWIPDILPLLEGEGDPLGTQDLTTHRLPLAEAPHGYEIFQKKEDECIKVVLEP